ncbi:hypothetical protein CYY_004175 [Polysphondylium violaceum]|uniref:CCCH-type zinc finger-containing protein n=1 Tax=Polysphondylium violaceum TaxID=133409 RepID=A0A8J4V5G8_9MYCE|nr:hypothetical protein CYY_004175 [Polysphondylium violaceum]
MYKSKQKEETPQQQDFPIACESCLGDSPYMTMTKEEFGKECKICTRPFNVFRWKPGRGTRFKSTEICKMCAQVKNVCQVCIHDLEFGLPVQVRDAALASFSGQQTAVTEKGIEYQAAMNQKMLDNGEISYDNFQPTEVIKQLARTAPYHKKNQPHVCTFFLKGNCNRGDACPYSHSAEQHTDPELAHQDIRDRYNGINDPVAERMLKRAQYPPKPPLDKSITTLFLGDLDFEKVKEEDIKAHLFPYGTLKKLKIVTAQNCAFATFNTRQEAETAISQLYSKFNINENDIRLNWSKANKGKPKVMSNNNNSNNSNIASTETTTTETPNTAAETTTTTTEATETSNNTDKTPAPPKPAGVKNFPTFKFNAVPPPSKTNTNTTKPVYSSMDPSSYGGKYAS